MADQTDVPQTQPNSDSGAQESLQESMEYFGELRNMLAALVVPDESKIQDITGREWTFSPVMAARQQIKVALKIEEVYSTASSRLTQLQGEAASKITEDERSKFQAAMWFIRAAITDEVVEAELDAIWEMVHPGMLDQIRGVSPITDGGVMDYFEIDQIVEGLLPFFVRFGTRMSQMTRRLGLGTETKSTQPTASES